ncbi:MAG: response regulator transcription factor [Eubacteriales bacterium]|nr:response regulator transcription factor [Eubacteriales bacterium]
MSKVLIVEDDMNILRLESDYLQANGFDTETATDGKAGLELALNGDFDLILLDVMLPEINGFEICKKIRQQKNIPVIFVTAKREEIDKITGLGFGADDYIVKPFSPGELVARVKAHITRYEMLTNSVDNADTLCVDNLKMNKASGQTFVGDKEISLTKKEFDVLYILASHPTTVFGKNELFEKVWGYDSLGDTSTLTVHINRLREKLKEADPNCDYIKTAWGRGYKFK